MKGKIDERSYPIEKIVEYHPRKGYLIQWKNYPESARSWQKSTDMPSAFKEQMKFARTGYESAASRPMRKSAQPESERLLKRSKNAHAETNPEYWIINEILDYDPEKGYFVSWMGCNEDQNSWQLPLDMPEGCRGDMKVAQQRYRSRVGRSTKLSPRRPAGAIIPKPQKFQATLKGAVSKALTKTRHIVKAIKQFTLPSVPEIHSILAHDPARGYLVHWKRTNPSKDSWVPSSEITETEKLKEQMLLAEERYNDSNIPL
jgi:hypothetical protein